MRRNPEEDFRTRVVSVVSDKDPVLKENYEVNMREKYESLSLAVLKELAKSRGMKGISALKKSEVIEAMLAQDEKDRQEPEAAENQGQEPEAARSRAQEPEMPESRAQEPEMPESRAQGLERAEGRTSEQGRPMRMTNPRPQGSRMQGGRTQEYRQQGSRVQYRTQEYRTQGNRVEEKREEYRAQDNRPQDNRAQEYRQQDNRMQDNRAQEYRQQDNRPQENRTQENRTPEYRTQENRVQENRAPEYRTQEQGGAERTDRPPTELSQLDSGQTASGILEVMPDGFGFIRSDNYLPGENDVYVSPSQIRRFNLKTGDIISGNMRIRAQQEKFGALLYLKSVNGRAPSEAAKRYNFEDMTPIFPNERLRMERGTRATAMRIVDLFSPIGKGQRGMIVSPPKAGKTTLLKYVARSILQNDPDMKLLILLIDERPEEVTDIKEAICGENVEVIYSTFDELPEHHKRVSEMVIERAKRLVEQCENVTILLDSITRLARAYNLTVPPSGRTLSGGLDPAALHMPKRFFGAARNMREGGSLTVLATALVDTGSKMDDVVYEEFKGTGNMELVLDRKLSEKRVFPAVDIPKSGTRREDLLLDRDEQEAVYIMRRALNGMKSDEAVENILNMFVHTKDNRELVQRVRRQKFI